MCTRYSQFVFGILISFLLFASALANNPPNKGKFPKGFWNTIRSDVSMLQYGDPGWVMRMEQRRLLRQQIALGKAASELLPADQFSLPVLLGQFADSSGTKTVLDFQNLLFDNNPSGTMIDYYNEVSYGQFSLTGKVYGWFTADQGQAFYASNNNGLNPNFPNNNKGFVLSVVQKADPTVDFSKYDNDGPDGVPNSGDDDGYADGVMVVYAGAGADWFPGNSNLWPAMSTLGNNEFTTNDAAANGGMIKVNAFAICPERAGGGNGSNQIRPIGVFAHEFGHLLGLPDLYDRTDDSEGPDFEDSEGIGEWCLMATGSWGGNGAHPEKPAHMSAWCKIQMGWITPTYITQDVTGLMIKRAETNAEAVIVWEDGYEWSRYFLLENRQQTGFDQFLNGPGLLIFHVDENQRWGKISWATGPVNDDETHKLVDLESADGNADLDNNTNRGDSGDPFPGSRNNRSFTDASIPNSRDYDGLTTSVEITNISNSGPTMTVDIVVRQTLGYALAYDENGVTGWGWGFSAPQDTWGGVLFTTAVAGSLAALDVGFRDTQTTYEINVYQNFTGTTPSDLLGTLSGNVATSGWHTIAFTPPLALNANSDFFVSLKIANKSFALSYDRWGVASGRSYASGDGVTYSNSISTSPGGGDLNIRARVKMQQIGTAVSDNEAIIPNTFALHQNYPNPFNPATTITFQLPVTTRALLKIFDMSGKEVEVLFDRKLLAGYHKVEWTPNDLPSGVYLYKLQAGELTQTRKLILVK
jgi:immune inhibitor A